MCDRVEERAKAASQYVDSLYNKTPYQLREELRKLYVKAFTLQDCVDKLVEKDDNRTV